MYTAWCTLFSMSTCIHCSKPVRSRGLCATHYQAANRAGLLTTPVDRLCRFCNGSMAGKKVQAMYCSENCRVKAHQRKVETRQAKRYNLTTEEHTRLLEAFPECGICGKKWDTVTMCIDHSHTTGAVRGLLCSDCNFLLGHFQDDPVRIQAAIMYREGSQ